MHFQVGAVEFDLEFNLQEYDRESSADFAAKDIVGAERPREPVGVGEERLSLRAVIHPYHFGGLATLDVLNAMRVSQLPQIVVRGDGRNLGWFVIESVHEGATWISRRGIGRVIEVAISLVHVPTPSQASMVQLLLSLF